MLALSTPVMAQYGQYGQYGYVGQPGAPTILIDKMVGKGTQTKGGMTNFDYTDNLSTNDARYQPGQDVMFRIRIKNPSNMQVTGVTVKDILPAYLEGVEGPGEYNGSSNSISFNAGDFNAGEEKTYYIKARIKPQNQLPADKAVFCLVNRAQVMVNNQTAEDTAQFCVEKEVTGVVNQPQAGPELALPLLAGQFALLGLGYAIKKKTS